MAKSGKDNTGKDDAVSIPIEDATDNVARAKAKNASKADEVKMQAEDATESALKTDTDAADAVVEAAEAVVEAAATKADAADAVGAADTDDAADAAGAADTDDAADAAGAADADDKADNAGSADAADTTDAADAANKTDEGSTAEIDADAAMAAAAEALKAAQAQAAEWQDKFMRLHAEWDTYRRRTNEQREAEKVRATEKLVTNLLPVIDDFERTIDYAQKNGEGELLSGVEAVHAKFVDVLTKGGVEVIDPAGEAYDALEAQAVATVEDASVPDETVNEVYQKGYRMGTKVLRPAMVTVTTGGPKRELAQEE